jgi:hypothetical protein
MRKPVRYLNQTGFLDRGGETGYPENTLKRLNFTLKVLARDKLDSLRFWDANLLQRLWVYTFSGLSFNYLESAESDKLYHLVLLNSNFDGINDRRDCPFRFSLASFASKLLLDCFD